MNKLLAIEAVILAALITLICVVPSRHISAYQDTSAGYEHAKNVAKTVVSTESDSEDDTQNTTEPDDDETVEESVISVSRAIGGYNAYVSGSFAEPTPFPDDDTADIPDADTEDDTPDNSSTDNGAASEDDNSDDKSTESQDEVTWTKTAAEDGTRATALGNLYFRTTPSKQSDDNVILTIPEGETFEVVSVLVESTDSSVKNWMEVKYDGKTGYVVKKYTEIKE